MTRTRSDKGLHHVITLACWAIALSMAAWALLRVLGLERGYPLIALIAFTPHVTGAGVAATLMLALLRRRGPAVLCFVATAILIALVAPRGFADGGEVRASSKRPLRVMLANVALGGADPRALVRLVRQQRPDVLSIQELTPEFAAAAERAGLRKLLPARVSDPAPGGAGNGLYSRRELVRRPHPPGALNVQSTARMRFEGVGKVELTAVHPPPPLARYADTWDADLRSMSGPYKSSPSRVLAGDFNATLDHANFRDLLDRGYTDAAAATGEGLTATWPTSQHTGPWVAIDHVIFDAPWRARSFAVLPSIGSDHLPIIAVLEPAQ